MQCSPTRYMLFLLISSMNAKLEEPKRARTAEEKSAYYGIVICCDCGSSDTTLSKKGVYCNECKSFRRFEKKKFELLPPYARYDDDD